MKRIVLHRWHRRFGIFTALFVVLLAVTGWFLNHTDRFSLDESYVSNDWLLDWYGIKPQSPPVSFNVGDHRVTQVDAHLYFDTRRISTDLDQLIGAVKQDRLFVVAARDSLYLLLESGDLVEKLGDAAGVPSGMRAIGLDDQGQLIIRAAHGIYTADLDAIKWRHTEAGNVDWSQASPAPQDLMQTVLEKYRGTGLSYERVLLDLHSGRLLGEGGVVLIDLAALLFVVLAVTGCVMWWRGY